MISFSIFKNQKTHGQIKFKCLNEKYLKFIDKFGEDKIKEMNKDDDVETDDSLVTGTQKSVLRNLKEAIKQYEMLKEQGE